jgi:hypothetical protein
MHDSRGDEIVKRYHGSISANSDCEVTGWMEAIRQSKSSTFMEGQVGEVYLSDRPPRLCIEPAFSL